MNLKAKRMLIVSVFFIMTGIILGAFGAHGLKDSVDALRMKTFETGVDYHLYHGLALFMLAMFKQLFGDKFRLRQVNVLLINGIMFFSFGCYLYAMTGTKMYAMVVPIGGLCFILGWILFLWKLIKLPTKA